MGMRISYEWDPPEGHPVVTKGGPHSGPPEGHPVVTKGVDPTIKRRLLL